ncbi:MAG TPA: ribonuclease Y [Opitutales bacterium]|jgi:ribonuclease Y|nr:ribonuclease Y [Opitutales bacterium]
MDDVGTSLLLVGSGAAVTLLVGWVFLRIRRRDLLDKAQNILNLARKEAEIQVRDLRTQAEHDIAQSRREFQTEQQTATAQRQTAETELVESRARIETRADELAHRESFFNSRHAEIEALRDQLERQSQLYRERLRASASLNEEQLRNALREEVRTESAAELRDLRNQLRNRAETELQEESRRILIDSLQRLTSTVPAEIGATLVRLPNEEMKGRIIGREGRNIKAFESATGVTLMIDETPDAVLVSSFDPVRREVARLALERLVADGRIHPASIEEFVRKADDEVRQNFGALGEKAVARLHLSAVNPELVSILGKLHFRLSNNQNTLDHSVEVASICSFIAAELGLDPEPARRAGLFHDLGKALNGDHTGSHALAAADLLRTYGEDPRVINAVAAHHQEVPPESVYAPLLIIADALSAARPGARSESIAGYLQRVKSLEDLARGFPGVTEAYAMQAGREVRVIVAPEKMTDDAARQLAFDLRHKIENDMNFQGTIKITVIREARFSETAK